MNKEAAGFLVGKTAQDLLIIYDSITGPQEGSRTHVELSAESQAHAREKLKAEDLNSYVVGWYHSHPGLGVFMSGTDIQTQQNYQYLFPDSVALVIDPAQFQRTKKFSDLEYTVFQVDNWKANKLDTQIALDPSELVTSLLSHMNKQEMKTMEPKPLQRKRTHETYTARTRKIYLTTLAVIVGALLISAGLAIILMPAQPPPTTRLSARFSYSPHTSTAGQDMIFNASSSMSYNGLISSYYWDFGDRENSSGSIVSHSYKTAGNYSVALKVTNIHGDADVEAEWIVVVNHLKVKIDPNIAFTRFREYKRFTGEVTGGVAPYSFQWYLDDIIQPGATSSGWTFRSVSVDVHWIRLDVSDSIGNTNSSYSVDIVVSKSQ